MRDALGPRPPARAEAFLELVARRFRALEQVSQGGTASEQDLGLGTWDRALARRVLQPHEATWHDGDDNLVRGHLDRWERAEDGGPARVRSRAAAVLAAVSALTPIAPRKETVWCLLWHLESHLAAMVEDR